MTPIPRATIEAVQFNQPIDTKLLAVIASQRRIDTTHLNWLELPQVIFVESIEYQEVIERLGESQTERFHDPTSLNAKVWFVVFEGKISITEPSGKTTEPGNTCAFAILNPENGEAYSIGSKCCSRFDLDPKFYREIH